MATRKWTNGGKPLVVGAVAALMVCGVWVSLQTNERSGSSEIHSSELAAPDKQHAKKNRQPSPCDSLLAAAGAEDNARTNAGTGNNWASMGECRGSSSDVACAARSGSRSAVKCVLSTGAPIDEDALPEAAFSGSVPVIQDLLAAGANIESAQSEFTALARAAEFNHYEAAVALIAAGANVNGKTPQTPLSWAAYRNSAPMVRLLIQHGASVDRRTCDTCETPLMVAAKENKTDALRALLDAGANPYLTMQGASSRFFDESTQTFQNVNALRIAYSYNSAAAAQILREYMRE